jgi:hypothetical protein
MKPVRRQRLVNGGNGVQLHGACCRCKQIRKLTAIVMLPRKCPTSGQGWGCVVCHLETDGALAVLCRHCGIAWNGRMESLLLACKGQVGDTGRVPISQLRGDYRHDLTQHPEALPGFVD